MADKIRSFIAFPLPESVIAYIKTVQDEFRSQGFRMRWVKPENIHLTLKFLGDIHPADIDKIAQIMADTVKEVAVLKLSAKGVGVFPGIRNPRVLWIGLKGDTFPLIQVQKELEEKLDGAGFPKESRSFKAHLTIARIKERLDSGRLVKAMETFGNFESETFSAENMILYKSDLKPGGAVYTKLKTVSLKS